MKKQEELIFAGILIIVAGIAVGMIIKLLTFLVIILGAYFVIRGLIEMNKPAKSNKTKRKK